MDVNTLRLVDDELNVYVASLLFSSLHARSLFLVHQEVPLRQVAVSSLQHGEFWLLTPTVPSDVLRWNDRKAGSHSAAVSFPHQKMTEQDLRNNRILDDLVTSFQAAR